MSQIKKGALISYAAIFLNITAGLLYTPWMVRHIGSSDYGLYALIGAFLSYFMMDFGLGSAIARFVAAARAKGNDEQVSKLIATTTKIYLIIDAIIFVALAITFIFISGIFKDFTPEELLKFKTIFCIAGLFSILNFPFMPLNGVMIAYEKFTALKTADMAQKLLIVILMVMAIVWGYGLFALVFVNGIVGLFCSIYKFLYIRRNTSIRVNLKIFDSNLAKQLFKFSVWVFVIGIAQRLLLNIAPTIIGIYAGTTQIAIFSIGMVLEAYTWTFANALNGLFITKITKLSIEDQPRAQINDLMLRVGRLQLLIIGAIITGIIVLGKSFIILWMGQSFANSYYIALCIIVPGIITLSQEVAQTLLFVENEVKYRAVMFICASVVSVVIGVILVPLLGAIGVGIGIFTALMLCHVIGMNIIYSKVMKLDIVGFFRECHLKMIIPMLLSGGASVGLQYLVPTDSWMIFIGQGVVFTILFYSLMWSISMNEYEKSLIKGLIINIKNKLRQNV